MKRFFFVAVVAFGCTQHPDPIGPNPDTTCAGACMQGRDLECHWASASPGGVPCVDWCSRYHAVGYMRPWADCVAAAGTVSDVRACGMSCR